VKLLEQRAHRKESSRCGCSSHPGEAGQHGELHLEDPESQRVHGILHREACRQRSTPELAGSTLSLATFMDNFQNVKQIAFMSTALSSKALHNRISYYNMAAACCCWDYTLLGRLGSGWDGCSDSSGGPPSGPGAAGGRSPDSSGGPPSAPEAAGGQSPGLGPPLAPLAGNDSSLETHTDSQADRQTDRQADRPAGRQTGRQADRQIDRQTTKNNHINNIKHCFHLEQRCNLTPQWSPSHPVFRHSLSLSQSQVCRHVGFLFTCPPHPSTFYTRWWI